MLGGVGLNSAETGNSRENFWFGNNPLARSDTDPNLDPDPNPAAPHSRVQRHGFTHDQARGYALIHTGRLLFFTGIFFRLYLKLPVLEFQCWRVISDWLIGRLRVWTVGNMIG